MGCITTEPTEQSWQQSPGDPDAFEIADDEPIRALSWRRHAARRPASTSPGAAWRFLSHLAGRTTITPTAAALLLGAILVTNLLLAILEPAGQPAAEDSAMATAQAGLAIAWTTVYAVLADGPGELVPGMYLTAVLVAFTRTDAEHLRQLGLAAGGGYALSVLVRLLSQRLCRGPVGRAPAVRRASSACWRCWPGARARPRASARACPPRWTSCSRKSSGSPAAPSAIT